MGTIVWCLIILLATLAAGCIANEPYSRPFTDEWSYQVRQEKNAEKRKEERQGVLFGNPDKTRAAVSSDGQGGTGLNIGRKRGLSADLGYDRGPEGGLRYRHEWDFAKPRRPKKPAQ